MKNKFDSYNVKFKIKRIKYKNPKNNYCMITATIESYNRIDDLEDVISPITEVMDIRGTFQSLKEGDTFEGIGNLQFDKITRDKFLYIPNPRLVKLEFEEEVSAFLQRRCKHKKKNFSVGKKTAEKIVEVLGLDAISKIIRDKNCLKEIQGMSDARIDFIYNELVSSEKYEELLVFLESNNLRASLACSIYQEFKENSIVKIKENPYVLYKIISNESISFKEIDRLGKSLKFEFNSIERVCAGILFYIDSRVKNNGDLYVPKHEIFEQLYEFLLRQGQFTLNEVTNVTINEQLFEFCFHENLLDQSISLEINNKGDTCVYRKKYKYIENNIVKSLVRLITGKQEIFCTNEQISEFIDKYQRSMTDKMGFDFKLAENQKKAIYMALTNGFSILTGGPGTGKTQTTNSILKCIRYIRPDASVLLLAPTGKASKRMEELCEEPAQTIHRGLKLNPIFNKKMNEEDILNYDFVIVDESSMIDADLCNALLERVSENTKILLVGDVDQLPSVGAGLILRDLIDSGKVPVTRLTELFRQAQESQIVTNSHKIIKGDFNLEIDQVNKKDFFFWNSSTVDVCKTRVLSCITKCFNNGYSLKDICILSPMKVGELGTRELNKVIQSNFNDSTNYYKIDSMNTIKVKDRVMQTRNNYDLEAFNGEIGDVVNIKTFEKDVLIEVDFGDRVVSYTKNEVEELELAYCITIHKSQGSEFPAVITIISDQHESMLNRNLIYTAWTRAKKVVLNVGQKSALEKSIPRLDHMTRNSRIIEKLNKRIPD